MNFRLAGFDERRAHGGLVLKLMRQSEVLRILFQLENALIKKVLSYPHNRYFVVIPIKSISNRARQGTVYFEFFVTQFYTPERLVQALLRNKGIKCVAKNLFGLTAGATRRLSEIDKQVEREIVSFLSPRN